MKQATHKKIYNIVIYQDLETGLFVAEVPTLSPCITYGNTLQEAISMAQEAIEGIIESRIANGFEVTDDSKLLMTGTKKQSIIPIKSNLFHYISVL